MKILKKVIAVIVITSILICAAGAGLFYIKKSNQKTVLVVDVSSLASDYYMQDTNLEGTVTTNVSQSISVDDDMIVQDVFVKKGDSVRVGDKLVSFDMTLVEMELNIAKLKRQQLVQELDKAVNRLTSLKNGGPIEEKAGWDADDPEYLDDIDEIASRSSSRGGVYFAAAIPMLWASAVDFDIFVDGEEDTMLPSVEPTQPPAENDAIGSGSENDGVVSEPEDIFTGGDFSSDIDGSMQEQTPAPLPDEEIEILDPEANPGLLGITDGSPMFYQKLDSETEPFLGKGTKKDPYIFLCSGAKGKVTVDGSFLNKMAGYNGDGTEVIKKGGYWYQLEFHKNDTITNFLDRRESCVGYYLIHGNIVKNPLDVSVETEYTIEDALTYTEEDLPDDDWGNGNYDDPGSYYDDPDPSISREDAIKMKENEIATLKLDIQEKDIEISKLEKKVAKQIVYSKIDGIVAYVGDPATGESDMDSFLKVRSKEGYYISGVVSELMLDQLEEGSILNCSSYDSGNFEAEVLEVSDYPVSSDGYYGYGMGNPNVSYYSFSATIPDKSVAVSDQDWLTITLQNDSFDENVIVLSKAFVRSENGVNYVYKDQQGVLKKQTLLVGGTVDGGYSVLIKGGLSRNDKIAFPYGDDVIEGAKTREGTLEEMYGY